MTMYKALLKGPLNTEQRFKKSVLNFFRQTMPGSYLFEIENTEKEPGMPDVLSISRKNGKAEFFEFKVADASGVIKFERTQPLWYAQHKDLAIQVIAYLPATKQICFIPATEILALKARKIRISEVDGGKLTAVR